MDELSKLRKQIDNIDDELVRLFEERMQCALKIAEYKRQNSMEVLNTSREQEVINKGLMNLKDKRFQDFLIKFLNSLMKISREFQTEFLSYYDKGSETK